MIGRFGQADPITEAPLTLQGWNRYAYVGNSPVNFTDPSGYCFMGCFWNKAFRGLQNLMRKFPIIGMVIRIAAMAVCITAGPACAPIMAFLSSAFVTGVTSGSLGQALKAGAIAAVTVVAFQAVGDMLGGFGGGGGGTVNLSTTTTTNIPGFTGGNLAIGPQQLAMANPGTATDVLPLLSGYTATATGDLTSTALTSTVTFAATIPGAQSALMSGSAFSGAMYLGGGWRARLW